MGLFDELLGNALGTKGDERAKQSSSLVAGLLEMIDEPETGGIDGLANRSRGQGLGDAVASWIGTDGNQWRRIFEANRDQIQNPDLIRPGQKLKIPKA